MPPPSPFTGLKNCRSKSAVDRSTCVSRIYPHPLGARRVVFGCVEWAGRCLLARKNPLGESRSVSSRWNEVCVMHTHVDRIQLCAPSAHRIQLCHTHTHVYNTRQAPGRLDTRRRGARARVGCVPDHRGCCIITSSASHHHQPPQRMGRPLLPTAAGAWEWPLVRELASLLESLNPEMPFDVSPPQRDEYLSRCVSAFCCWWWWWCLCCGVPFTCVLCAVCVCVLNAPLAPPSHVHTRTHKQMVPPPDTARRRDAAGAGDLRAPAVPDLQAHARDDARAKVRTYHKHTPTHTTQPNQPTNQPTP